MLSQNAARKRHVRSVYAYAALLFGLLVSLLSGLPGADAFVMVSRYGEVTLLGSVDVKPRTDQRRLQFRKFGRVTWGIINVEPDDVSLLEELPPEDLLFYNNLYPSGTFPFILFL